MALGLLPFVLAAILASGFATTKPPPALRTTSTVKTPGDNSVERNGTTAWAKENEIGNATAKRLAHVKDQSAKTSTPPAAKESTSRRRGSSAASDKQSKPSKPQTKLHQVSSPRRRGSSAASDKLHQAKPHSDEQKTRPAANRLPTNATPAKNTDVRAADKASMHTSEKMNHTARTPASRIATISKDGKGSKEHGATKHHKVSIVKHSVPEREAPTDAVILDSAKNSTSENITLENDTFTPVLWENITLENITIESLENALEDFINNETLEDDSRNETLGVVGDATADVLKDITTTKYGDRQCPCMAFEHVEGYVNVSIAEVDDPVQFPADFGSICQAWDDDRIPQCRDGGIPGKGQEFCGKKWCFVDPCECHLHRRPQESSYLPSAVINGKPVFVSYATCGEVVEEEAISKIELNCGEIEDPLTVGSSGCTCIGVAQLNGTRPLYYDGAWIDYPQGAGSSCAAWDENRHPDCSAADPPDWCSQPWCYVDPCSCDVANEKATSLPGVIFQGKPLHYSYATCGGDDTYDNVTLTANYTGYCDAWPAGYSSGGGNTMVLMAVAGGVVVVAMIAFAMA